MKESTSHSRVVLPLHEQGIAIYSRKSRFTGKGESVGNQIELCRQYLRAHEPDAPEPEIFEDDGFSGGDLNRPAFRRMMRAAEAGRFRMLIVYRLDRISRSIGDFTALIERLAQLNVAFVSIREQFDTSTPMGRAMMYIASVFSQLERETIAERIRDNLRELPRPAAGSAASRRQALPRRPCRPSPSTGEQSVPAACGFFRRRRRPSRPCTVCSHASAL